MTERVQIGDAVLYCGSPVVMFGVLRSRHDFEVFNSVIGFVAVLMVDDLVRTQRPAKVILHHNAMFTTPNILPMRFRCENDIAICVVRFPAAKMPVIGAFATDSFSLEAPAALRNPLAESPAFNWFFSRAIAGAIPIVKFASLAIIACDNQAPETLSCEIGDVVRAPIACGGF